MAKKVLIILGIIIIHILLLVTRIVDPIVYDIAFYESEKETQEVTEEFKVSGSPELEKVNESKEEDDGVEANLSIDIKLDYFTGMLIFSLLFHLIIFGYITREGQPVTGGDVTR